jgi:DNA-binding GntR family transcriptional regulator
VARTKVVVDEFDDVGPLQRPGPLRQGVQDALRELIISRTLAPGQHLVETELAERLNVSRGPVREALQALHARGWVDLRPGRGAFVHEPTDHEVDEVFAVRAALESEAARLAAPRMEPASLDELREICERGRGAVRSKDVGVVVSANSAFHRRIAALSGIQLLSDYIASIDLRVRWFYKPVARTRGMHSWDEHERIIAALEAGDGATAARVMRMHTERTRSTYQAMGPEEEAVPWRSGRRTREGGGSGR